MNASILVIFALVGIATAVPVLQHGAVSAYSIHTPVSSVSSYSSHVAHPAVLHAPVLHAPALLHAPTVHHVAAPLAISHGVSHYGAPLAINHGLGLGLVHGGPIVHGGHGLLGWK